MSQALLLVGDSDYNQNLYYKTGFLAESLVYLELNGRRALVTSSMERGRAKKESSVEDVRSFDDYGYRELVQQFNDRGAAFRTVLKRVIDDLQVDQVVVEGSFPALYADHLRGEGISVAIDRDLVTTERRQKTEAEIGAIEEAQRATERATAHAIEILRQCEERDGLLYRNGTPLTAEDLRVEVNIQLTRQNMDTSQNPIIGGGPDAAEPHWEGEGPLPASRAIVMDVFPRDKRTRYYADMTRTVIRGEPSAELQAVYDAVLRAHGAALAQLRAGANGRDVHAAVEQVFREEGFDGESEGPRFVHGTGHGVGLEVHEAPYLGNMDMDLLENEVVTVEPGLYHPSVGAVRIEDLVVVTKEGYRSLTNFSKEFRI